MKLSKETLSILASLANINGNLVIRPGNELLTGAVARNILAKVKVGETFDTTFGIYDLKELLGVISLFNDPKLVFSATDLTITEGKTCIRYGAAEVEVLTAPKKLPPFPETSEVAFAINAETLARIIKSASALKVPFVTVHGDGSSMEIRVHDKGNPNSNSFRVDLGTTNATFDFHFRHEILKMLPGDYDVEISGKSKVARFTGKDTVYYLTCELDSTYSD